MNIARTKGDKVLDFFIILLLAVITLATFYPLYFVCIASISDPSAISMGKVFFWPVNVTTAAYEKLIDTSRIWIGYRNSLLYTVFGTLIQLAVTLSAAFALSRKSLPGRKIITVYFIITMYISGGMIPTFLNLKDFGMLNTPWALLIPFAMNVYNMIVARSYFEGSIPESIYESATIDGAGMFTCYFRFALPLSVPMIAVLTLNFALAHWNEYFNAMIYISDNSIQTLQVIIKQITASASSSLSDNTPSDEILKLTQERQLLKYAVVVVASVPMLLLYPFIQRYLISGIMIGAVKG